MSVRWLLCSGVVLMACLIGGIPTPVGAQTLLLGSDPANTGVLRSSPTFVRLWFSTPVDTSFSTAIVENAAHTYVNDRDAELSSADAREMEIHLSPHLPAGVYAVVWRAVSDEDGRVLTGSFLFAIAQVDGMVPGQEVDTSALAAQRSAFQFFWPLQQMLIALVVLGMICWAGISLWLLSMRRPANANRAEQRLAFTRKQQIQRLRHLLGWGLLLSVGVAISLALIQRIGGSDLTSRPAPAPALHLQQSSMGLLDAFHAALLTTDKHYLLILDVNTNTSGLSTFTLSVEDVVSREPISDVDVALLTTMLDMPMGTETIKLQAEGKGRFRVQDDLSMGGLWQIGIQLHTPDHRLHEAAVKLLTPY